MLKLLLDRLRNETTRIRAVRALAAIAASSLQVDISAILEPALQELSTFLRKANTVLRQVSRDECQALRMNSAFTEGAQCQKTFFAINRVHDTFVI